MVNMFSYTSLLLVLVGCWCYVDATHRKVTFSDDSDEHVPTTTTDYRVRCKDHIRNHDETDIDCGGIYCPRCANTKACKNKCDCVSGVCENHKCGGGGGGGEKYGLCSAKDLSDSDPILTITFGNGVEQYSRRTPSDYDFTTTYKQKFEPTTTDGHFSLVNSIHDDFGDSWHTGAKDHTGDEGGYMFLVNADINAGEFYRGTVNNLCIGHRYEFSVYLANICKTEVCLIKPNVLFQVREPLGNGLLAELSSGDVPIHNRLTWRKYGLSFTATSHSAILLMISNAAGGSGNDLAIDDITLRSCGKGSGFCQADN